MHYLQIGYEENGWLYNLGVVDFAGCGPVHLTED